MTEKQKQRIHGQLLNPETNPCLKEHELSNKCLVDNNYENDKCFMYFENYRNCKKFWLRVEQDRRSKGITPHLPPIEEREKIKEERRKKAS